MIEQDLEEVYVTGSHGTVWRAIEVFKIGEMQGTHNERLRIIKLLEKHLAFDLDIGIFDPESNCQLAPNHLIALIKGEQK